MELFNNFIYLSLLSSPVFILVFLYLTRTIPSFSFKKSTVSKSILLLKNPNMLYVFRMNFVVKALLDSLFYYYLVIHFKIDLFSVIPFLLFGSSFLFGLLAIVVEGKYSRLHSIIIYLSGCFWALGFIKLVYLVGSQTIFLISLFMILIPVLIGLISLFLNKTNVIIQIVCVSIWYLWLIFFLYTTINF